MSMVIKKNVRVSLPPDDFYQPMTSRIQRLTDPEVKPAMDAMKARIKADPAYGQELLRKAGIVDEYGKLTKAFGGN